jgi:hypothetical protein
MHFMDYFLTILSVPGGINPNQQYMMQQAAVRHLFQQQPGMIPQVSSSSYSVADP